MQSQLEQLEKDSSIEWQEYKIGELFEVLTTKKKFNAADVAFGGKCRYVARGESNNGIRGYITEDEKYLNEANTISFGQDTATMFYQSEPYFTGDKIKVFRPRKHIKFNRNIAQLFISAMKKAFSSFSWGSSSYNVSVLNSTKIQLPTVSKNGTPQIALDFMEKFVATLHAERVATLHAERVATLHAYLKTTGLKDYALTANEQAALDGLDTVAWAEFSFSQLFENIVQGRRLKKQDQISGKMPFVMAGVTNAGVVDCIGNEVRIFPKNSLTVDIFGNVFYRSYEYGMGDDTGAYWNTNNHISKFPMLYIATTMQKFMVGKFDFGHKLRSSRSVDFKIQLPINSDRTPNYNYMTLVISAMQKVVIKNVVDYLDVRIEKTGEIVG